MHRNALNQKRIDAQKEMAALASSIGEKLDIKDAEEKVKGEYHRDPQVRQLYQDEALVELLRDIDGALSGQQGEPEGLEAIEGIGEDLAEKLREAGIYTVEDLAAANESDLVKIEGIGKGTARKLLSATENAVK